ncbi:MULTISPECIES: cupin domain-containing protein [Kitasatospora]|uniref:Mannose-6-phosphate isomerase-like protein (Cupin superfamily) n=2 Tax=Kitasatospora TaxID=2063 RepID=A0ABT1ITC1_9ACTN|nr:cupin domain-containing protein [Kitasatospora paracochleata]MCP2308377.1 mannose-6-phosphate isomerase-like protein (cupin superfamily) [Kitasatospora paracochleata]
MRRTVILADTRAPADVHGVHGTEGLTQWACLARRVGLNGAWEAVEWARIPPGGVSGEHRHTRTEEVYVLLAGHGEITLDGRPHPVRAGDAVLTGLGTRHGLRNLGTRPLEWLVIEMPAAPAPVPATVPAPRAPVLHHAVVTNLRRIGPVDPRIVLTGPLRLLEADSLPYGGRLPLRADRVEHTLFVTGGSGRAAIGDDVRVPLVPGRCLTLPLGSRALVVAGVDGLSYVHAELLAPAGPEPEGGGSR